VNAGRAGRANNRNFCHDGQTTWPHRAEGEIASFNATRDKSSLRCARYSGGTCVSPRAEAW
jgi:hypothetical protein